MSKAKQHSCTCTPGTGSLNDPYTRCTLDTYVCMWYSHHVPGPSRCGSMQRKHMHVVSVTPYPVCMSSFPHIALPRRARMVVRRLALRHPNESEVAVQGQGQRQLSPVQAQLRNHQPLLSAPPWLSLPCSLHMQSPQDHKHRHMSLCLHPHVHLHLQPRVRAQVLQSLYSA